MKKYKFNNELREALLIKKQERSAPISIFMDGEEMKAKCLELGRVKNGEFACLVSGNSNPTDEERYILEAV